jgi:hypothetical protein
MFVHDFVVVHRPASELVRELTKIGPESAGVVVQAAWAEDRDGWAELGWHVPTLRSLTPPNVRLGAPVPRSDATVIPVEWCPDPTAPHYPTVDVHLEVFPFLADVSHLHLIGTYTMHDISDAWTAETSIPHRAATLAIRRLLSLLAEMVETGYSSVALMPPSAPRRSRAAPARS